MAEYNAESRGRGHPIDGTSLGARLQATRPHYVIPLMNPRLQLSQTAHYSSSNQRVLCAVVEERSKTRAFRSSQRVRMTSKMKKFDVFLSATEKLSTTAGHHSPISAFSEGTMLGN
jgi:hypothetical protein